jgi:hypothetical protein
MSSEGHRVASRQRYAVGKLREMECSEGIAAYVLFGLGRDAHDERRNGAYRM